MTDEAEMGRAEKRSSSMRMETSMVMFTGTTVADVVGSRLDMRVASSLAMRSHQNTATDDHISIAWVTGTMSIHRWLSSYGSQAFVFGSGDGMRLVTGKVGGSSGNVMVQLTGERIQVMDVSTLEIVTDLMLTLQSVGFFLQKTKSGTNFTINVMVDRAVTMPPVSKHGTSQCRVSKMTTIGYALHLSSINLGDVLRVLESRVESFAAHFDIERLSHFIGPAAQSAQAEVLSIEPLPLLSPAPPDHIRDQAIENQLPQERSCKHVQLTRKEITYLIGRKGTKISRIRADSGATVKVVPLNTAINGTAQVHMRTQLAQYLRISGTSKQVHKAMRLIETEVYDYRIHGITEY